MVARILIIASVACVFNVVNGLKAPFPGFKPCKSSDDACMLQNTNVGIQYLVGGLSDFGIKSTDPDNYDRVDCSTQNLKFILTHVILTGMKNCKALELKRDEANLKLVLVLQCDLKLEAEYEMNGTALFVPIQGNGKVLAELPKITVKVSCNFIYKDGKDGEKHIRIKNFEHSYELKEKATLVFEGLYPDNEVLRTATNQLMKDSPNEIIYEIGPKMIQATVTRGVENINKFISLPPYKDISLD